jgi:hypothetical protein
LVPATQQRVLQVVDVHPERTAQRDQVGRRFDRLDLEQRAAVLAAVLVVVVDQLDPLAFGEPGALVAAEVPEHQALPRGLQHREDGDGPVVARPLEGGLA